MKLKPIITSLLETDAYKFSMGQVIFHQFNKDKTRWAFKCRNKNVKFTPEMITEIRKQIDYYCSLRFQEDELEWLAQAFPWIHEDYIGFLRFWHPRREEIFINENYVLSYDESDCGLTIETDGTWLNTSMYEIAILAIVNEVYFAFTYGEGKYDIEFQRRTIDKFNKIKDGTYNIGTFSEFGLRRRYSSYTQDWLIKFLADSDIPGFIGTSNVYLAKKYNVKAMGTQAHEFYMGLQSHFEWNPTYTNMYGMKAWVKEYETQLGIALTDTLGTDIFLRDFNLTFATLFTGVRHDSGDPIEWGEKIIAHYEKLGINPKTKTLLFSDSLDFERAHNIKKHFDGRINTAFGIGTFLSNPLDNPLNIVFKMIECNDSPVAKISDTPGKGMCKSQEYINYLQRAINWRLVNGK